MHSTMRQTLLAADDLSMQKCKTEANLHNLTTEEQLEKMNRYELLTRKKQISDLKMQKLREDLETEVRAPLRCLPFPYFPDYAISAAD